MGSKSKINTQKQYTELPSWLQGTNQDIVNNITANANNWANPTQGSLQDKIYNTALGNNPTSVNPYEQQLFDQQLNSSNNAIMRQFAGAGRGNSFSNLDAITKNTNSMTNQFMNDNINRNRAAALNAQQMYFNGLGSSLNQAMGAIGQNATQVNQSIKPGNSWFENAMNVAGLAVPILAAPFTGGASLAGGSLLGGSNPNSNSLSDYQLASMGAVQGLSNYYNPFNRR